MGRFLAQGLRFVAVVAVLYLLGFYVLTRTPFRGRPLIYRTSDYYQWKGGVAFTKFQEWDPSGHWDAIVIGSSHAYRGYDPREFAKRGYSMFNLGSTAQTPLSTYAILDHYVTSERTGLVIIDLYETGFAQDGFESVCDLTQNMSSNAAAAELALSFGDPRAMNLFTLRMMNTNGPAMYVDPDYKGAGFAVQPDSVHRTFSRDLDHPLRINERQLRYFVKCLDLCEERGLRVVLASHYYPHYSDSVRHAAFGTTIQGILNERHPSAQGRIRWFDMAYGHTASDADHFSDRTHLNEAGARLFTDQLLDSLIANGYLPAR